MTTYKSGRKNASRKARKGTRKIRVKRGGGGNPLHKYIRNKLKLKQPHRFDDIKFYGSSGDAIVIGEESMTSQEYNALIINIKRALKSLDKERKERKERNEVDDYALWANDYFPRGVIDSTEQLKLEKIIREFLKESSPKSKTPSKSPKSKTPSKKSPSKK